MPWYGMHLIQRERSKAFLTEHAERRTDANTEPRSNTSMLLNAAPTLTVVALWGVLAALLFCAANGVSKWDIVAYAAVGPGAMLSAGLLWGSHKSRVTSGLDAAIIVGVIAGALLLIFSLP